MHKSISKIAAGAAKKNSDVAYKTKGACKSFDCESNPKNNLALSRYVDFLLKADALNLEEASNIESYTDVENVIKAKLKVIKALKTACAFELGGITIFGNRYGVFQYYINPDYPIKGFVCMEFPKCSSLIHEVFDSLGVKSSRLKNFEKVYDYSALKRLERKEKAPCKFITSDGYTLTHNSENNTWSDGDLVFNSISNHPVDHDNQMLLGTPV